MSRPTTLGHVSLVIPVIDLAHIGPLISNLADIVPTWRVNDLDIQIEVDPTKFPGTDPSDSAAVQAIIDSATARLQQSSQKLQASIDAQTSSQPKT